MARIEGPVTDLGTSGPGFYQTRARGNKTGRVSPRQQVRGSARDLTFAQHGLIDAGAADPNQGQLFDPGPRPSDADVIKRTGEHMPTGFVVDNGKRQVSKQFGGAPGFMPNLNNKQKVRALESVAEGRAAAGTSRGGAPIKEVMEDRQAARSRSGNVPWYSGVRPDGSHDLSTPGLAQQEIASRAARSGTSPQAMSRAAAITSPQSSWDRNVPGSPDHSYPNLDHAEQVVQTADYSRAGGLSRDQAVQAAREVPTTDGGLPTMAAKAAESQFRLGPNAASEPISVRNPKSAKVPNFDASLRLTGGGSRAAQRVAASSYTVDRHDARAAGIGGKVLEDRVGVYDALAMTGTRTAFKNRQLPPNEQAREWVGVRGANQPEAPHQGMFKTGLTAGRVEVNPDALPHAGSGKSRAGRRSADTATRLGLPF